MQYVKWYCDNIFPSYDIRKSLIYAHMAHSFIFLLRTLISKNNFDKSYSDNSKYVNELNNSSEFEYFIKANFENEADEKHFISTHLFEKQIDINNNQLYRIAKANVLEKTIIELLEMSVHSSKKITTPVYIENGIIELMV